jgi:uncharacterized protein YceH (UPF0502 family)
MEQTSGTAQGEAGQRRWQPISAIERRILGVLAEKAKTTPDIYPMSLNAICTGCNQKNNRSPLMQLEPSQAEEALDRLRELGSVGLVEGYGRVQKYRHYLYEWLGVDKVELAVMAELLLRGDQTVGELRVRASRMEPIADLAALQNVLHSLRAKGLVLSLTSEGRGHVVTHALYKPREIEALKAKYAAGGAAVSADDESFDAPPPTSGGTAPSPMHVRAPIAPAPSALRSEAVDVEAIRRELATLRQQVAQFQEDLADVRDAQSRTADELRSLKDSLGG